MLPTTGLPPSLGGTDSYPVVRPLLSVFHHWYSPGGSVFSRCRLRIWNNRHLQRPVDWVVLITELPKPETARAWDQWNPGAPAREHLDQLATDIKRLHLRRMPSDKVAWFYHQADQVEENRPRPHHAVDRICLSKLSISFGKEIYFGFVIEPVAPEQLELATGGLVEL